MIPNLSNNYQKIGRHDETHENIAANKDNQAIDETNNILGHIEKTENEIDLAIRSMNLMVKKICVESDPNKIIKLKQVYKIYFLYIRSSIHSKGRSLTLLSNNNIPNQASIDRQNKIFAKVEAWSLSSQNYFMNFQKLHDNRIISEINFLLLNVSNNAYYKIAYIHSISQISDESCALKIVDYFDSRGRKILENIREIRTYLKNAYEAGFAIKMNQRLLSEINLYAINEWAKILFIKKRGLEKSNYS